MGFVELVTDAHDSMAPEIKGKLSGEYSKTFI